MDQLQIIRGDTFEIDIEVSDPDGDPIDFSGAVLTVLLTRRNTLESQSVSLLSRVSPSGLVVVLSDNKATITGKFTKEETRSLPELQNLYYWFISESASQRLTWMSEVIRVVE